MISVTTPVILVIRILLTIFYLKLINFIIQIKYYKLKSAPYFIILIIKKYTAPNKLYLVSTKMNFAWTKRPRKDKNKIVI